MISQTILLVIFSVFAECNVDPAEWKCTADFCLEYEALYKCEKNDINTCYNETLAIMLPAPMECSCCDVCIKYSGEGETCIVGNPGTPLPKSMCGPGLKCSKGKCIKMTNPGTDPLFNNNYKCSGGKCRCQNRDGLDIYGEFPEPIESSNQEKCACSELADTAKTGFPQTLPFDGILQKTPRCLPTGDFDPLQCYENYCFCVDATTGEFDTTIPPVFASTLAPGVPWCYNETLGHFVNYYRDCEKDLNILQWAKDVAEAEDYEFLFPYKIECLPDGSYKTALQDEVKKIFDILYSTSMDRRLTV